MITLPEPLPYSDKLRGLTKCDFTSQLEVGAYTHLYLARTTAL
jgi:hypothetical protein